MGRCSFGLNAQTAANEASKEPKGLRFLRNDAAGGLWQWPPSSSGVHQKSTAEDYNLNLIRHGQLLSSSTIQARSFADQNQQLIKGKRCRRAKMSAAPVKQPLKHPAAVASPLGSFPQRNPSKQEEAAESQLTIFYRGAVLIYNGVTPDQAQEIMLVAKDKTRGGTPSSSVTSRTQTLALDHPLQAGCVFEANAGSPEMEIRNPEVPSRSGFTAPVSLALSIGIRGSITDDMVPVDVTAESNSSAATAAVPRAIPQARKMSIVRFLEKRKNRLIYCKPYGTNSKSVII